MLYLRYLFSLQHKHQQKGAELKHTPKHYFNFHGLSISISIINDNNNINIINNNNNTQNKLIRPF